MQRKDLLTRILAVSGTVLVWIPLLAPLFFSILHLIRSGQLIFDYLMPAELFIVVLMGAGLLLWASLRVHAYTRLIAWSLGIGMAFLIGSQALAVASGLASGEIEPTGAVWILVLSMIVIYTLAVAALAMVGIILLQIVFRKPGKA